MNIYPDWTIFFQFMLFASCFWVFKNVLFPPILGVILERQRKIEFAQRELRERDEEGKAMLQEYQEHIRKARSQAQDIRNQARAEASQYEHSRIAKARNLAQEITLQGESSLQEQRQAVLRDLHTESQAIASQIVDSLLKPTSRS